MQQSVNAVQNLKPIIRASKLRPHKNCSEPEEVIQIDFGGTTTSEKDQDIHFLALIDRFSKYPTIELFDKTNESNVVKFLDQYIQTHGVSGNIRLDQARCK